MTESPADEDVPAWPLHERLGGAAIRAAVVAFPLAVLVPFGLSDRVAGTRLSVAQRVVLPAAVAFLGAAGLFLPERRDASLPRVLLETALGGAVVFLLAPLVVAWFMELGDPAAGLEAVAGGLGSPTALGLTRPLLALTGAAVFLHLSLPRLVRARTRAVLPQVLAGLTWPVLPALAVLPVVLTMRGPSEAAEAQLRFLGLLAVALLLAGVAPPLGDRLARRVDPRAPSPPPGRGALGAFGRWVVAHGLVVAVGLVHVERVNARNEAWSTLFVVHAVQSERVERAPERRFAATLDELEQGTAWGPVWRTGSGRYRYRLVRSRREPGKRWAAAAEPAGLLGLGNACYAIDELGTIRVSGQPFVLSEEEGTATPP